MTDSMNFGPEWLRNLSQDGCTQPCTTSAPRYQLAEHRYGREEMLALFDRVVKAPDHLSSIPGLYIEKPQLPLALIPMTEEETRMWNRGINSDAVLRLSGKAPTGMVGGPRGGRGGSVDRGRGRGRGTYHYSRGLSYEEPGDNSASMPRNIRPFERSQGAGPERGWSERNGADPGDWNGSTSPRKEFGGGRGFMNDNWRRHRGNSTEDEDGWRTATNNRSEKWIRSSSWREGDKDDGGRGQNWERGRNWDESNTHQHSRRLWDTEDNLPEWATENLSESGGSFDASGAFHGGGFSDNEEEQDGGHIKESRSKPQSKDRNQSNNIPRRPAAPSGNTTREREKDPGRSMEEEPSPPSNAQEAPSNTSQPRRSPTETAKKTPPPPTTSSVSSQNSEQSKPIAPQVESAKVSTYNNSVVANCVDTNVSVNNKGEVPKERVKVGRQKSEDDMDHMQEVADDLVAKLMEDEDKVTPTPSEKWFYQDPQGDVQGPFLSSEMAEWFRAGYFTLSLLVRRNCDERFSQLGDLIKMCGRVPFIPGPSFPPLKATDPVTAATTVPTAAQPTVTQGVPPVAVPPNVVPPTGVPPSAVPVPPQLDQEALLMRQYQYQLLHGQLLLRQQAVLGKLSQTEHWPTLSNVEKQQQVMQQMLAQQPLDPGMTPFMAQTHKNPVMQLLSQLQHPPNVPNTVPESQLSPSQLEPLQQLIQQMGGGLQHPPPHLHPDTDPTPIQNLLRQLGNKAPKPAMESVWGGVNPVAHSWLGPIPTPAAPPGQLWDLHGKDMKTEQQILEEQIKAEEERRREERRKQEETQRRTQEEEKRKQLEEELRKSDIEKQRLQEKMLRLEEERRQEERLRKEEERKRLEEKRRLEEKLQQEEELRRQQEEAKRLEEEAALARKREEALKKKEEEKRRKEEEKEKKRKAEEERKREEEERRRLEEEKRKQEEEESQVRRLEQQRRQTEALRRLQEQQQQRTKAAPWSPTVQPPVAGSSLADIQRQEKEKKEREQQILLQLQQQQQLQQSLQASTEPPPIVVNSKTGSSLQLKWAERKPAQTGKVKSLAEIQAEEQEQLAKQQERERAERAQQQKEISLPPSAGIWGAASQSLSWTTSQTTSVWGNTLTTTVAGNTVSAAGFWDEVAPPAPKPSTTSKPAAKTKTTSGSKTRTKKEEAVVMKLFEQNVSRGDEFTQWCSKALGGLQSSVDIPTFVGFLRDIESPYEVKDYVRLYLGEGKEAQDFARQFLERRSKWRSAQRAAPLEDDMCVPAPAVNPINTDFQEVKGKGKKAKKSKFRVDKSILGFNVIAAEDRINVGDRDYGEGL